MKKRSTRTKDVIIDHRKTRPFWCYDKKCKIVFSTYNKKSYDQGYSSFCYGALPKLHTFKCRQAVHRNNMCYCYYTPLKGAIRFLCNENDVFGEIIAMIGVLNRRLKTKCRKCGRRNYKVMLHQCDYCEREKRRKAKHE